MKMKTAAWLAGVAGLGVWLLAGQAQGQDQPAPTYAGAASCMCHADPIQKSWQASKHARAFELLKLAGQEKNAKCLPCHTTGYGKPGGYGSPEAKVNLEGVQCEECHGPAGGHVSTMDKTKVVRTPSVTACSRCHQSLDIHAVP